MFYAVRAIDKADSDEIRRANRNAHLDFLKKGSLKVHLAGPLLETDGAMRGSLLVVEADTELEVKEWLEDDPYSEAGLFETVEIDLFKWVVGSPEER